MYKTKILKFACISVLASSFLHASSLKESVEKVLSTNPEVISQRNNQEAFKKYIDERKANYLPRIDIDGRIEKSNSDKKYDRETPPSVVNGSEQEDGYNFGIALNQMLYDGDLTPSQVREAKHNDLANKFRTENIIENVVYETISAYLGLVQYDETLALTADMISTNEDNLQIAKEKESISGEVLETYEVDSKLNFVKEKYLEEKDLKSSRISTFKRYVGVEPSGNECRPKMDLLKIPDNLQQLIELAVLRNNEIQEQIERIKAQREKIAQADSKFLPNLNLELKALTDNDLSLNENGIENQVFGRINLAWNLYNGGGDYAVSQQEALFLKEQKERLDAITNKVVESMKVNYQRFLKNQERIDVLKKYVVANENIVEVYKSEFESGTRTFVDILDAQTDLYEAKKSLVNREFELYRNYYDMLLSLSMLTDSVLDPKNDVCSDNKALASVVSEQKEYQRSENTNELKALLGDEPTIVKDELKEDLIVEEKEVLGTQNSEYKSFLEAPEGYYTINITTTEGLDSAKRFVNTNSLSSNDSYVYPFGPEMKSAKVIYGIFKSVKEASLALENLPSSVKANKPYIDNILKHQKLYFKYNK
ncbi:TolC family protein [Arcobacter aquimarinus]|uniref:Type I secretion system outer membrane protein, TolC family n=1 Tax=Arcobacter aquimarinus TaxID=1315211 RepID=A0AAE7DZK6_9BACT|nr:TolC family protein [Arcobacter aquimarinus]QKE25013.1 type I secretion system outer membrane protein, TolC family [Arcobacter aquimarinus]RXI31634.1 transporter [Arcobacter aquimarinus]